MMKLLPGSHPLPAWLQGHQGHQGKILPVPILGTQQQPCCSTIFLRMPVGEDWTLPPTTCNHTYNLDHLFWCHCRCSPHLEANMRQTIQKLCRSKQVSRYRGPYAISKYSVDVGCLHTLCRLFNFNSLGSPGAPNKSVCSRRTARIRKRSSGCLWLG